MSTTGLILFAVLASILVVACVAVYLNLVSPPTAILLAGLAVVALVVGYGIAVARSS